MGNCGYTRLALVLASDLPGAAPGNSRAERSNHTALSYIGARRCPFVDTVWSAELLGGLGWFRAFGLALAAGPLFGGLVNVAMLYAPLSHTATVVSGVSMLGGMVTGWLLLGERVTVAPWAGSGAMIVGLGMLMLEGGHDAAMPNAWIGDLLFIAAGGLWTSYTFMLRRWGTEPVLAVSAVNVYRV